MRHCWSVLGFVFLSACAGSQGEDAALVKAVPKPVTNIPKVAARSTFVRSVNCVSFADADASIPLFVPNSRNGIFITRITKPCEPEKGKAGFEKDTEWMAMGLPCTGGRGAIDITGKNYAPKMLGFLLTTDCSIAPATPEMVREIAKKAGLGENSKLLAYNPMSVQFWEVDGFTDTDVGYRIELRSDEKIKAFWNDFKARTKNLHIKIYGRENAWVQDDNVFMAEGNLIFELPNNFRFDIEKARVLSVPEVEALRARCQAIKPQRNCNEI